MSYSGENARSSTGRLERPSLILIAANRALGESVVQSLAGSRHILHTAHDLDEALAAARREQPELAIVDVSLPGGGLSALRELKADPALRHIPVLLLAQEHHPRQQVEGLEAGAHDVLTRPLNRLVLPARVRALLKHRDAVAELRKAHEELEQQVRSRTAELSRALDDLKREVSERKNGEAALLRSHAQTCQLMAALPSILIGVDSAGQVIQWNPMAEQVFELGSKEVLGKPFASCGIRWRDPQTPLFILELRWAKTSVRLGDLEFLRADGSPGWLGLTLSSVSGEEAQGRKGLLILGAEITKHKQLEQDLKLKNEQLLQAQKMEAVGQLAGGVAHDFNNLTTIINGYSGLLLQDTPEGHPNHMNLEAILKAGQRAADLTRKLLVFGRRQVLQLQVLDLNAVLVDTGKMMRRVIGEDIELAIIPGHDLGRIKADHVLLENVILNLAINARDAMSGGGKLTLETRHFQTGEEFLRQHAAVQPGAYVMLTVSDTGCGMAPETLAHVFEPFFTTKPAGKGTGLGLSTVFGTVKQIGGHIWVASQPGQGTTITILLPRVEEEVSTGRAPPATAATHGQETVLVVEDEDDVRTLTVKILQQHGYHVLAARDGHEAVQLYRTNTGKIHLLLSDVVMPRMGGLELLQRLAALHPNLKVLLMSGHMDRPMPCAAENKKALAFLNKPFAPDVLAGKVRQVLDEACC